MVSAALTTERSTQMEHFYDLVMPSITDEPVTFSKYRDIACLIVNVASQ